ncbi:MAG: response regulator [Deltaproteobacteria bacterium]|nr:response regulator [Deltaproteobacteria bacterium]
MDAKENLLKGKKVLIVDDEPDVLDTLEEILQMCTVVKAGTFEEAKNQLKNQRFDLAILDIMGVNGYQLLEIAVQRRITAVMLTAHALSPEDTIRSYKGGAAYYIPKDKMRNLLSYLGDVMEAKEKGKSTWIPFMGWADAYYSAKFGSKWKDTDKDFWEKMSK